MAQDLRLVAHGLEAEPLHVRLVRDHGPRFGQLVAEVLRDDVRGAQAVVVLAGADHRADAGVAALGVGHQ